MYKSLVLYNSAPARLRILDWCMHCSVREIRLAMNLSCSWMICAPRRLACLQRSQRGSRSNVHELRRARHPRLHPLPRARSTQVQRSASPRSARGAPARRQPARAGARTRPLLLPARGARARHGREHPPALWPWRAREAAGEDSARAARGGTGTGGEERTGRVGAARIPQPGHSEGRQDRRAANDEARVSGGVDGNVEPVCCGVYEISRPVLQLINPFNQ
ncbi:hypothetical protein OBBRIDRAFT_83764 [Obba rivulosa]|uniref:Uncharacterized protein n=1 Tax=Obba rivulosa TaxID=1052685 RepID=A0A8E2DIR9_9APHY|nr:hypothetical protein OBBRIDRAFT_83764 [Obba rivulosa]